MRGGSLPLIAWGTVLLVLYVGNWIWEGRAIQVSTTLLAILIMYLGALLLWLLRHDSVRRGPPPPSDRPEPLPQASSGAMMAGLGFATILFGFAWATFLVYFGAGLLVLALGRIAIEIRSERESLASQLDSGAGVKTAPSKEPPRE